MSSSNLYIKDDYLYIIKNSNTHIYSISPTVISYIFLHFGLITEYKVNGIPSLINLLNIKYQGDILTTKWENKLFISPISYKHTLIKVRWEVNGYKLREERALCNSNSQMFKIRKKWDCLSSLLEPLGFKISLTFLSDGINYYFDAITGKSYPKLSSLVSSMIVVINDIMDIIEFIREEDEHTNTLLSLLREDNKNKYRIRGYLNGVTTEFYKYDGGVFPSSSKILSKLMKN